MAEMAAHLVPATLSFALSRRGLFYPLASLDISGQWPVFGQEPHLTDGAYVRVVNAPETASPAGTVDCRARYAAAQRLYAGAPPVAPDAEPEGPAVTGPTSTRCASRCPDLQSTLPRVHDAAR